MILITAVALLAAISGTSPATGKNHEKAAAFTMTLTPMVVTGGGKAAGTIELTDPAPAGGMDITLTAKNKSVGLPAHVRIPADSKEATFDVTTTPIPNNSGVAIEATTSGSSRECLLTIKAAILSTIRMKDHRLAPGNVATCSLTLTGPAPPTAMRVALTSDTPYVVVPGDLTITPGSVHVEFPVTVGPLAENGIVTVTATAGKATRQVRVLIAAPRRTAKAQ